ncbi:MAG: alkaline phosphatase D family protein [Oleiphilaceae bacterium]|nr:alkaline phosphatase D family protein [Oleiphilaceae bacterium]
MRIQRRTFVQSALAGTVLAVTGCGGDSSQSESDIAVGPETGGVQSNGRRVSFDHGVASGDPLHDRVILWTRVTPLDITLEDPEDRIPVVLKIARNREMTGPVTVINTLARARHDYCVKVDAEGLEEDTWYYYSFQVGNQRSVVGRTRTFPRAGTPTDRARYAIVSCSNFPFGFFSAYKAVAEQPDLDFVLHLGDYIYEYAPGEYGNFPGREPQPPRPTVTLADYRERHGQYKTDPDQQAVHQQFPMICIWDDHESTNNSHMTGAENHDEATEGSWDTRKNAAIKAYFEWMPIREIASDSLRIWRRFAFGDLIDLFMLDTRLEGRDPQLENPADPQRNSPDQNIISEQQMNWLLDGLSSSAARWRVLGNQVMFGQFNIAEIPGIQEDAQLRGNLVALNMDQWDGYAADRQRILNHISDEGIDNVLVHTGDIHSSWAIEVYRNSPAVTGDPINPPLAAEFVCPAVTSPALEGEQARALELAIPVANPHMKYIELETRGFILVDCTRERTQAEWYYVRSIESQDERGQLREDMTKLVAVDSGSSRLILDGLSATRPRSMRTALNHPRVTTDTRFA